MVATRHGHTERMTRAVYGRVTGDRITAAAAVIAGETNLFSIDYSLSSQ